MNNGAWQNHNDTLHLESGYQHSIEYKSVANWRTPQPSYFYISNNVAVTGTYTVLERVVLKIKIVGDNGQGSCTINNRTLYHNDTIHTYIGDSYYFYPITVSGFYGNVPQGYTPISGRILDSLTLTYTPIQYGILKVNLQNGNNEGAWTALDQNQGLGNLNFWYNSTDTLVLPTHKTYTVYFRDVAGWTSPAAQGAITLPNGQTTTRTGVYTQNNQSIGILVVRTAGDNGQGRWTINAGNTWQVSGDTLRLPLNNNYYIQFQDINGYFTPNYINYAPTVGNQISNFTGTYLRKPTGILKVNLTGGNGQGQWRIDSETTWHNSGDTLHRSTDATHYVYYKNVAGFITPNTDYASLTYNQTTTIQTAYLPIQYGTVQVNLTGENGLGQWRVDSSMVWHNSGDTVHLSTNIYHRVYCKNVLHFTTPYQQYVYPDANIPQMLNLEYQPIVYGILKLNLVGAAGLAKWRINNDTTWRNSGDTAACNVAINYVIYYKDAIGWIKPTAENFGATANQQTTLTRTYTQIGYGILKVNIAGGDGLGQWSIDYTNNWRSSGDTVHLSNVLSSYTIRYNYVNGWVRPDEEYYTPIANQTTTKLGTYTRPPFGILKVNLTGANGQGLWSTDQLIWHASGDTLHLTSGNGTYIYFAPVAGWIKPAYQNTYINASQTTTAVGNYTQPVGTEVNTPTFAAAIMPNPANDYLRCTTSSTDIDTPLQINLYNSIGVLLYSGSLSANDEQRISTVNYPNGFYILQIYEPRTKAAVLHKVIIQH